MENARPKQISTPSDPIFLKKQIKIFVLLLVMICISQIFSYQRAWVENVYSNNIYQLLSKLLRLMFGWVPISVGDLLYGLIAGYLFYKIIKRMIGRKNTDEKKKPWLHQLLKKINLILVFYLVFLLLWGFNYHRQGIAYQLRLTTLEYDSTDLLKLNEALVDHVNYSKAALTNQKNVNKTNKEIFDQAIQNYHDIKDSFPFIHYEHTSVKSSLWGWLGNYLGFSGYYNPFTGEAQINTTGPGFLHPFVTSHEIAHQLGYAGEMEANFVGYLAAVNSKDTAFQYAGNLELFLYANQNYYRYDSVSARKIRNQLSKPVQNDLMELMKFNRAHQSFLEPVFNTIFDLFLKSQHQKQGVLSYNEVVGLVIAINKSKLKIQK